MKTILSLLLVLLSFVNCTSQPQPLDVEGITANLARPLPHCECSELITMADTTITGNNVYPASLAVPTPGDSVKTTVAPGAVAQAIRR